MMEETKDGIQLLLHQRECITQPQRQAWAPNSRETQLDSKDNQEATRNSSRTRAIGGAKPVTTYRKAEDSSDYDVQLQSRKAKRHGELDI